MTKTNGIENTPEAILEAARPVRSPLHKFFEWNDKKGAEKYRLEQAASLVLYAQEQDLKKWAKEQRKAYRAGKLTSRQITKLEALPGWKWNAA